MHAKCKGPKISQGRLEALKPSTRVFAFTEGVVGARNSDVVTGQLSITTQVVHVLFDSGATHSFIS